MLTWQTEVEASRRLATEKAKLCTAGRWGIVGLTSCKPVGTDPSLQYGLFKDPSLQYGFAKPLRKNPC